MSQLSSATSRHSFGWRFGIRSSVSMDLHFARRCLHLALCVALFFTGHPAVARSQEPSVAQNRTAGTSAWRSPEVTSYPGQDITAKIDAAVRSCRRPCSLHLPSGDYRITRPIGLPYGITLSGDGRDATILRLDGPGPAVDLSNNSRLQDVGVVVSPKTQEALRIAGEHIALARVGMRGGGSGTILVHVTAVDAKVRSGRTRIDDLDLTDFAGIGLLIDHAVDTFVRDIEAYSSLDNRTAHAVVIDSGSANVQLDNINGGASGAGALLVRHTMPGGTGQYGISPVQIWCYRCVSDGLGFPGDAIHFDKSLQANDTQATLIEPWAAGFENGIHIEGGQGIKILGGVIRANTHAGILLDDPHANFIDILGAQIQANGYAGIEVAADLEVSIGESRIGNVVDTDGRQEYGIHVRPDCSNGLKIIGNDLRHNIRSGLRIEGAKSATAMVALNAGN